MNKFGTGHRARRESVEETDGAFGRDKNKPVCVELERNDLVTAWVKGTRRKRSITAVKLLWLLIRRDATNESLEKARQRKARLEEARKRNKIAAADRAIRRAARRDTECTNAEMTRKPG